MNYKEVLKRKTILIILPILILQIATLIAVGITNAANNATEPETEQTFTEDADGYYIWVRAVDHAGNKGPWSEAQRIWIETGLPTITIKTNSNTTWAQTGSVTVALQDSKSGLASGASVKYGWSESLDTAPSSYTEASLSYTAGTKEEVTFTAQASGLTGKYYLWVVPITLADTAGNTQTATAKSTGQFYFDNKGPTAPVIQGGNTTYNAASLTIGVKTAATDEHIGTVSYYEYYSTSSSTVPTATTSGTKTTTSTTSQTFASNIAGDYVYFRGVDSLGNKGTWSSYQRLYIDVNDPTVSAKNSSVTITKGDNVAMSTYFNTDKNGNAEISSTTYKIGSTSYANTSSLAVGTYTVTCTVTKANGKSKSATMTLTVKSALPETDTKLGASRMYTEIWDDGNASWLGYEFTVPDGVTVVKLSARSANYMQYAYIQKTYSLRENQILYIRDYTTTLYIQVTPGKYYYLFDWDGNVYYSESINNTTPNYDCRY